MHLTTEEKKAVFKEFGGSDTNTGSMEAQVAIMTERINHISEHLKVNKKDHSARLSLLKMVGKRRKFLRYIAKKDINNYRALIEKLGLRK
ncbi:MAG: 30S ribosomal protein S15 [Saprospiraceae bacterium]|nr:30S ribosomal protein S15 [Saprospiraceae bacterium]